MKRQAVDDAGERRDHERAPDVKRRRHDERSSASSSVRLLSEAKEEDPHRLAQRQKQLDYGKNTVGYDRYCAAVPRWVVLLAAVCLLVSLYGWLTN